MHHRSSLARADRVEAPQPLHPAPKSAKPHPMQTILALTLLCFTTPAAGATIYLVRHAERQDDSKDTVLSEAGKRRAAALRHTLMDAGVGQVFVTHYVRTHQTAEPLAALRKIAPKVMHADELQKLIATLAKIGKDDVALVVGHSDTVPDIVKALSGEEVELQSKDYDDLFVLRRDGAKRYTLTRLHYGAPNEP
jgi:phosphohistidine phosphatase SixA